MRMKKEINVEIGMRAKNAREQAKLTQEQLAEKIEVSVQYISDMERGLVGLSLATLKRLCVALCVSSDQLLFADPTRSPIAALGEKCNALTERQQAILLDIIEKYVEAVS